VPERDPGVFGVSPSSPRNPPDELRLLFVALLSALTLFGACAVATAADGGGDPRARATTRRPRDGI